MATTTDPTAPLQPLISIDELRATYRAGVEAEIKEHPEWNDALRAVAREVMEQTLASTYTSGLLAVFAAGMKAARE